MSTIGKLPTRTLGRTGMEVTQLGYGSMGLRGPNTWGVRVVSDEDADAFLNRVLDVGINFIDTAPDYGVSEQRIGDAIAGRRDEYFLATKCGCAYVQHADHIEIKHVWEPEVVQRNLETSLQRMRTDYVDLLQFHGGDAETLQRAGLIDQLVSFREQGLIRHVGVSSNFDNLPGLIALDVFETFQLPYSCLSPANHDLMSQAAEAGAGVIVRGGIAHGGPDAEIRRPALNDVWQDARLDELLDDDMTRAELILRFTLSHPNCHTAIVGTCNAAHLDENLAAARKGGLPNDLRDEIKRRVAIAHDSQQD